MKNTLILVCIACCTLFFASSCHKERAYSTVYIQNNTNTDLALTFNGSNYTVPVGSRLAFDGYPGSSINGQALSKNIGGSTLSWNLGGYYFPTSADVVIPIDAGPDYFYLYVINNSYTGVVQFDVNNGNAGYVRDYITVPNDGYSYGIGYYRAFTNTDITLTLADNSYVQFYTNLPFIYNQAFTASFH